MEQFERGLHWADENRKFLNYVCTGLEYDNTFCYEHSHEYQKPFFGN